MQRSILLSLMLCLFAAVLPADTHAPSLMLWAWEQPEDLRFVNPQDTGIAYLARTIFLKNGAASIRPRLQPLRVPADAFVCAVLRIESDAKPHTKQQREAIVNAMLALASRKDVSALQLDYDAVTSERAFYIALVEEFHNRMPSHKPLSVTALASWCLGDRWIAGLPVAEAVPMLFRMGPDGAQILRSLNQGEDFNEPLCRASMGISTDEPGVPVFSGRRIYAFHPGPWTVEEVRKLQKTLKSGEE